MPPWPTVRRPKVRLPIKYWAAGNRAWMDKHQKDIRQMRSEKYLRRKLLPSH